MPTDAPEVIYVDRREIWCDGGHGALGHPRVYLRIDVDETKVECGYCDRLFILKDGAHADDGH